MNFKPIQIDTVMDDLLDFAYNTATPSIIKVIGVGGGGGNAVNHMYKEGIQDVTFVLCNTDNQALIQSSIPRRIQLGREITQGLGAGNRPERARLAAEESINEITEMLNDGTKMVFITAGMGGGTGTGAAPVIAKVAKEMDILTVGIVTVPFVFEGERKILQALDGVEEMSKHVDALLVINNERLCDIYPDLTFFNAFGKADNTLTTAAKSIAEIITVTGHINLDFADVNTILKNGGVAIMSSGYGSGDRRVTKAIDDALNSPLLNNNDVFGAKRVLINLYFSKSCELKMEEIREVDEFMVKFGNDIEVIWGAAIDDNLDTTVKITLLATGFGISNIPGINVRPQKKEIEPEKRDFVEKARIEAEERNNRERIEMVYGKDKTDDMDRNKARASYVILNIDQMDDNQLIEMIDKSPAYNRESNFISKLFSNQQLKTNPVSEGQAQTSLNNNNGVIRF